MIPSRGIFDFNSSSTERMPSATNSERFSRALRRFRSRAVVRSFKVFVGYYLERALPFEFVQFTAGGSMRRTILAFAAAASVAACSVTTQQEVQMGQDYAQQVNAQLPIVSDPELNRYINVLGDSIARLTSRGSLDWQFFIVDSKEVNAF